jgi:hypothetical protein
VTESIFTGLEFLKVKYKGMSTGSEKIHAMKREPYAKSQSVTRAKLKGKET